MKTRHVVAIGILTAIAVGLLAIGIKATGQKPKVQTDAYYQINSYNYTDNTFAITGQPSQYNCTFYENGGVPSLAYFNYTINYDDELEIQIRMNGFYYIDTEINLYEVHQKALTYSVIESNTTQISLENIETISIYQNKFTYQVGDGNTRIDIEWQIRYGQNGNQVLTINSGGIVVNQELFLDDVTQSYYVDGINIDNLITKLKNQYQTGYTTGYQIKGDLADGNFVSIQETMLNVLTMPFTFISQGFNVTLWQGTPYAINIGNFIKSLIAIATILFIIKMFTSGFSVIGNYTTGTGNNISQWRKNRSERKLNESKARLNDRTNPNHKTRDSHVTIKKE